MLQLVVLGSSAGAVGGVLWNTHVGQGFGAMARRMGFGAALGGSCSIIWAGKPRPPATVCASARLRVCAELSSDVLCCRRVQSSGGADAPCAGARRGRLCVWYRPPFVFSTPRTPLLTVGWVNGCRFLGAGNGE